MVALSFHENFREWEEYFEKNSHKFFALIRFALLRSNYFNVLRSFQNILILLNFTQMPSSYRYEKVKCENCGTQTKSSCLRVTRRVVQLEHCIASNFPISPHNHKLIRITILLRSTAPQNLISPSSVNFFSRMSWLLCFTSTQRHSK